MLYQNICIVGAGAIGGWLGAGLARAGCHVSFLARGETLAALQTRGLQLQAGPADADGVLPTQTHAVRASNDAAELGVQDLVIIAVKAPALREAARQIAPLLGDDTVVLTAMNGVPWWFLQGFGGAWANRQLHSVDAEGVIASAIPAANIVGGVVHASCSVTAPGVIRHGFGNKLIIGEPSGKITTRITELAALLERAGFEAPLAEQIQRDIWFKLWGNMTMNPVSALTGATSTQVLDDDLVRGFCSSVMLEAKDIGARLGIVIDQQPEDRHAVTRKLGAFKTSMLQDVEAGKAVELDALVGAVQELGQLTQVATPYTDALLGLARLHARVRGLY
ncbi:MAG: 2-dehydropantoate 2-reductase [Burkholderiaceae bacterium]|nr:2-dehydropantoate 2-reductase [Burkholderiaceae bacterium]